MDSPCPTDGEDVDVEMGSIGSPQSLLRGGGQNRGSLMSQLQRELQRAGCVVRMSFFLFLFDQLGVVSLVAEK